MWPDDFDNWLDLARDLEPIDLRRRLMPYPILLSYWGALTSWAVDRATRWAERRRRFPAYFTDRLEFARAFCERAWAVCLRRSLTLAPVAACLANLPQEQRRLLWRLYIDQSTFAQAATVLKVEKPEVIGRSRAAYRALRSQIALRLGEAKDGFPQCPAAVGYAF